MTKVKAGHLHLDENFNFIIKGVQVEQRTDYQLEKHHHRGSFIRCTKRRNFGFLGPNGAGKTTTIHMIAGLMSISNYRKEGGTKVF
jgi:ABC-type uncharacterized transport system ATPase subunit